jgi:hypothetical protein
MVKRVEENAYLAISKGIDVRAQFDRQIEEMFYVNGYPTLEEATDEQPFTPIYRAIEIVAEQSVKGIEDKELEQGPYLLLTIVTEDQRKGFETICISAEKIEDLDSLRNAYQSAKQERPSLQYRVAKILEPAF